MLAILRSVRHDQLQLENTNKPIAYAALFTLRERSGFRRALRGISIWGSWWLWTEAGTLPFPPVGIEDQAEIVLCGTWRNRVLKDMRSLGAAGGVWSRQDQRGYEEISSRSRRRLMSRDRLVLERNRHYRTNDLH